MKTVDKCDPFELGNAILDFMEQTFADSGGSGALGEEVAVASEAAFMVDLFASQYRWQCDAILDAPLAQLFQLRNVMKKRMDSKAIVFNRETDLFMRNRLRELNGN